MHVIRKNENILLFVILVLITILVIISYVNNRQILNKDNFGQELGPGIITQQTDIAGSTVWYFQPVSDYNGIINMSYTLTDGRSSVPDSTTFNIIKTYGPIRASLHETLAPLSNSVFNFSVTDLINYVHAISPQGSPIGVKNLIVEPTSVGTLSTSTSSINSSTIYPIGTNFIFTPNTTMVGPNTYVTISFQLVDAFVGAITGPGRTDTVSVMTSSLTFLIPSIWTFNMTTLNFNGSSNVNNRLILTTTNGSSSTNVGLSVDGSGIITSLSTASTYQITGSCQMDVTDQGQNQDPTACSTQIVRLVNSDNSYINIAASQQCPSNNSYPTLSGNIISVGPVSIMPKNSWSLNYLFLSSSIGLNNRLCTGSVSGSFSIINTSNIPVLNIVGPVLNITGPGPVSPNHYDVNWAGFAYTTSTSCGSNNLACTGSQCCTGGICGGSSGTQSGSCPNQDSDGTYHGQMFTYDGIKPSPYVPPPPPPPYVYVPPTVDCVIL